MLFPKYQANVLHTYTPLLELSNGTFIRKTTAIWLFQEGELVSSDRLFKVRAKQPFSNDTMTRFDEYPAVNGALPIIMETVEVGDMCVFNKDHGWEIGRILQFSHHEKKEISAHQYKGRVASTKNKDLGVLCTWFQESTGTYRMCASEHHCYFPLSRYVCTLTCQCFIQNGTSESNHSVMKPYKQNTMATFEDFTLTKEFIVQQTCINERTQISQPEKKPQSDVKVQSTQQSPQPVIIIDDNASVKKPLPKWITINDIISDKDILLRNEWLNDQHMNVAQSLLKEQHPHINGLTPTVLQGRQPLPTGSLQIIHTDGDHWVAVSTFNTEGADTIVYDPKYSSVSKSTQTILAKLVNTDKPAFSVRMASVLKQSGSSDCGLFAIAYVTHITKCLIHPCVFSIKLKCAIISYNVLNTNSLTLFQ